MGKGRMEPGSYLVSDPYRLDSLYVILLSQVPVKLNAFRTIVSIT